MKTTFVVSLILGCPLLFAQNTHDYGGRIVEGGINNIGTVSGTNTFTATPSPALTAYAASVTYCGNFTNANTAAATLNISSLGAKSIVKNASSALVSGDIGAGSSHCFVYDGTNLVIQSLDNTPGGGGNVTGTGLTSGNVIQGSGSSAVADSTVAVANLVTSSAAAAAANQICVAGGATKTCSYIDFPQVFIIPSANCVSTVAGAGWDTALTPTCTAGSNNLGGTLPFVDTSTAQFGFSLPEDWNSAVQPYIRLIFDSGSNTTGTVIFNVATACSKEDGSVTSDPAFTTADAMTTKTMAAATRDWGTSVQMTLVTSGNNCIPGGSMRVKITRATDTASTAVNVKRAILTIPRRLVVQAN